ncbi:undecaprenyldiphospho-muramoylpentapeptide beta-N-acetylglucosaminyltransferase [Enterovirga rhinocerotis]|uniref:UDP-N-acetylglucosamine--N-acetylmuramyl-(pentapeptide) pyrophosphoryl-undecaprenol N-acetylglucosamine transferase n=1 Tax=Enterovirga rhinocerotis TaxID=1339210 RepID=A0A4R7CCR1_9HYPH|nr:undecaprenyldiphospho-muramoylpentapeptide beta-N-acetylglucosaminyltransferase [Enterovirga rhinocerotis]TDR94607.1 UDP-N-acetylglucosamine-N-acetylmuramylpentapeptide N-acetylglucosamine transferase [Enterovirga rhinocerotis]
MSVGRPVLLAAGGTGGHLFPAEALAVALRGRGVRVFLATDGRVEQIAQTFPAERVVRIPSATPSGGSIVAKAFAALKLGRGVMASLRALRAERPACVVGFGGYPTVPPVFAATILQIPTLIHEQNGVIGRANKFLLPRVSAIATGFADVKGVPDSMASRRHYTGNPIRPAVIEAARTPYAAPVAGGDLRLAVFGGSQGARIMSEIVPPALLSLPPDARARLHVDQQARPEDLEAVRAAYAEAGIAASVEPFFKDLPARMAAAHLVISRSGASTVAELAAIGRPSVLVPLPGALDQDQAANAKTLAEIGAATLVMQPDFTPERVATEIAAHLVDPSSLVRAAASAKGAGITDAAERLADVVLNLAGIAVSEGSPATRAT